MMDFKTFTLDVGGCPGLWNCPALLENTPGNIRPMVYFRKPKNVSQEEFDRIIKSMRISMVEVE